MAGRAVAWNIILARERRDVGHFFYGVVVRVSRQRRAAWTPSSRAAVRRELASTRFAAPGVALVLWFVLVEALSVRIISRGPSSSAPTVDCALVLQFEAGVLPASCACKHCLCAMRTSEFSHQSSSHSTEHWACPKNRGVALRLVPLSCYGAGTGAGRNASPGAGRDGLRGAARRPRRLGRHRGPRCARRRRDPERSGERLLTPAGGHLLDGRPAERPSGRS